MDAHGLSSGYSAQTRVTFNRPNNSLDLNFVSRPDAPKQYPNFYVDPEEDETINAFSLTQDVMTSSGKQRVSIYLDADCEKYRIPNYTGEGDAFSGYMIHRHLGVRTQQQEDSGSVYKLHFINLDRQKDDSIEIRITDFRND